jgi:hypothetical protein
MGCLAGPSVWAATGAAAISVSSNAGKNSVLFFMFGAGRMTRMVSVCQNSFFYSNEISSKDFIRRAFEKPALPWVDQN